jgi:hypothetical protein
VPPIPPKRIQKWSKHEAKTPTHQPTHPPPPNQQRLAREGRLPCGGRGRGKPLPRWVEGRELL